DLGELLGGRSDRPHDLLVDDRHAVLADRPHRQLLLAWRAELADDDHVEGGVEPRRDLRRHRHAAAGQPQDDDVRAGEVGEPVGELPPGVASVGEAHGRPPPPSRPTLVPEPGPLPGTRGQSAERHIPLPPAFAARRARSASWSTELAESPLESGSRRAEPTLMPTWTDWPSMTIG